MADAIESAISLPALPVMVVVARAHVERVLAGIPRLDDACVVASELVTNSLRRSNSGFAICVRLRDARARIEVTYRVDEIDAQADLVEIGPGLGLIALLADDMGDRHDRGVVTSWAELTWNDPTDTEKADIT